MLYSPAFTFSSVIRWVFCRVPGFALGCCASFKPFGPLALAQQAPLAIIFQALRCLRGSVLFRGSCPSSTSGFPFWFLGLTVQSSRPAFSRCLPWFVSLLDIGGDIAAVLSGAVFRSTLELSRSIPFGTGAFCSLHSAVKRMHKKSLTP